MAISINRRSIKRWSDYESIGETIGGVKGVEAWTPRVYSAGLGSVGEKSTTVQIIGIDAVREVEATRFDKKIIDGWADLSAASA